MFKVGDKTLTIDPWFGNDLLTIVEFRKNGDTDYAIFSDGGFFRASALRLATKEEIAAGHRINLTSDTIDDSDLEYHVSPLCKVEVK
ncbi:MAG: hypothetical protein RSC68_23520 [Acinetobacter sp.]